MKKLILFFILFLITRVLVLITSNSLYWADDNYYETMAKELNEGANFRWYELPFDIYLQGSSLQIYFIAGFYRLFGLSAYAFNIIMLIESSIMFLLLYVITKNYFSKFVHYSSLLLFIFAPPVFVRFNLVNTAEFVLGTIFCLAIFLVLLKLLDQPQPFWFVLLGLLSGFGFFVNYIVLLAFFIALIFVMIKFRFKVITVILSALIGSMPFWYYSFYYIGRIPQKFKYEIFRLNPLFHFFGKLFYVLFVEFRNSTGLSAIYEVIVILSIVMLVIYLIKSKDFSNVKILFPLMYVLLFFIAYSQSSVGDNKPGAFNSWNINSNANEYYYTVIWPFIFILVPCVPKFSRVLVLIMLIFGVVGLFHLVGNEIYIFKDIPYKQAYCYEDCFDLSWHPKTDIPKEIMANWNTLGYRFFLRFHQHQSPRFGASYPVSLCSKLGTEKGKVSCLKVVMASYKFFYNSTDICHGPNNVDNALCVDLVDHFNRSSW